MKFSLKNVKGTAVNRLKAWNIYDVVLRSIDYVSGTSAKGTDWQGMKVVFSGDQGIFEHTFFCPNENGFERVSGETNGRKWVLPSSAEVFSCVLAHLGETLSKDKYTKFQGIEFNLPEDFEKLINTFKEVMAPAINKTTSLKLVANNKGYADIPNFVGINSNTDRPVINNNWIGKNVTFSDYEIKKMHEAKEAKPSEAPSVDVAKDNSDLNFNV